MLDVNTRALDQNESSVTPLDISSGRFKRAWRFARARGVQGLVGLVRHHGLKAAASFILSNVRHLVADRYARRWDRKNNVNTAGSIRLDGLTIIGPHRDEGNECLCTSPSSFRFMMNTLSVAFERFTFVDIGVGKGRTLLLASHYPFMQIVGVEFAQELAAIARRNVMRYGPSSRRCDKIAVLEIDATAYRFPDTPLVVYFYNPFSQSVFDQVLSHLEASLRATPRDCVIVYGSSSHNAIGWAKPAILRSASFRQIETPAMPFFADAVRTVSYAVFAFDGTPVLLPETAKAAI
ncbi:MAG TPA: class I SAM-dependent methyltransferase [Xanthobacteraceae bacterium]|jgi:SAM-dependent methyltransferase|nr:class I SAM-dependent methyltransferase [Xanthobacteraceae bacterium]